MFHRQSIVPTNSSGCALCACSGTSGFLLNTLKENMNINPEAIIASIEKSAGIHYAEADSADRLAWQVGALTAKIRELSALLQYTVDQLEELRSKKNESL